MSFRGIMDTELEDLQNLLNQLLSSTEIVLQRGINLSDQMQGLIADQLNWLYNRIQELQNPIDNMIPIPPQNPELQSPFPSSNINSFGYDDKNGRLLVKFQGDYPQQNGPIYAYDGIPKVIFDLFQKGAIPARTNGKNAWGKWWKGKVPSLGASLYTLIRNGGYNYTRLT